MRALPYLLLVFALLAPQSGVAGEDPALEAFVQESRGLVKAFAGSLKGALQSAIAEGGPPHAIGVCKTKAPEIARGLSEPGVWTVGRTSHKIRNPGNAPDDWETDVLEDFLQWAGAGEEVATMEVAARVERDGREVLRYMKAIPVGEACLACHGAKLEPALAAEVGARYPEDRATGFALGELRGAFTITKTRGE